MAGFVNPLSVGRGRDELNRRMPLVQTDTRSLADPPAMLPPTPTIYPETYVNGMPRRRPVQFRAKGGPVKAGMPYMVGEEGAELMVPKTDGKVVSHAGLQRVRDRMKKNKKKSKPKC